MHKPVDNINQRGDARAADRDDDLLELIHAVMHRHRAQRLRVLRDGPHALTHMESRVLNFFGRHSGATQSDLAQHSGRDKAQLARLVKTLRDRGLLGAEADAADRRQVRLALTADGQAVQRALRQQDKTLAGKAVGGLSADERQQLAALLRRVMGNLDGGHPASDSDGPRGATG